MPLIIVLIVYLVFVTIFLITSFFILYHLLSFGFLGDATKAMSLLYVLLTLVILVPTLIYVLSVPWFDLKLNIGALGAFLPFIANT
jgi:hypothetical protein